MKEKKWTHEELFTHIKANSDYGSAVIISALYKKIYGEYPKIGLSGYQAGCIDFLLDVLLPMAKEKEDWQYIELMKRRSEVRDLRTKLRELTYDVFFNPMNSLAVTDTLWRTEHCTSFDNISAHLGINDEGILSMGKVAVILCEEMKNSKSKQEKK